MPVKAYLQWYLFSNFVARNKVRVYSNFSFVCKVIEWTVNIEPIINGPCGLCMPEGRLGLMRFQFNFHISLALPIPILLFSYITVQLSLIFILTCLDSKSLYSSEVAAFECESGLSYDVRSDWPINIARRQRTVQRYLKPNLKRDHWGVEYRAGGYHPTNVVRNYLLK